MNHEFQSLTEANQTVYYSDRSPQRMIREPSTLLRLARDSCVLAELTSHRLARQSQGSPKLFLLITVWDLEVNPVAESESWWRVPGRWCGATPEQQDLEDRQRRADCTRSELSRSSWQGTQMPELHVGL